LILVALAALGAAAVAFVLYPVFGNEIGESVSDEPEEIARERIDLEEKKNRLYESITDLDFERDAGKVSPADFETARNDYLAQVSAVLTRLDELSPKKTRKKKAAEPEPRTGPESCAACGEALPETARFCPRCGKKVH
jgi:hypothetical protein